MIEDFYINKILTLKINSLYGLNSSLDQIFVFFATDLIFLLLIFFLSFYTYLNFKRRSFSLKQNLTILFSSIFIIFTTTFCKFYFDVPRPFIFFESIKTIGHIFPYNSFYSAHTTYSFMLYFATRPFLKPLARNILLVIPIGIGVSRIVTGIHFTLDIIVAIFVAWIWYMFNLKRKSFDVRQVK